MILFKKRLRGLYSIYRFMSASLYPEQEALHMLTSSIVTGIASNWLAPFDFLNQVFIQHCGHLASENSSPRRPC